MAADNSTDIRLKIKITKDYINAYRSNVVSYDDIVGYPKRGEEIIATKLSADKKFFYVPVYKGWVQAETFEVVSRNVPSYIDADTYRNYVATETVVTNFNEGDPVTETDEYQAATSRGLDLNNYVLSTEGVFAMPYQFDPRVDRRLTEDIYGVGRKYAEKIISRNNLLYLTPGRQVFMQGASDEAKNNMMKGLMEGTDPTSTASYYGRYYSLEFALDDYYKYVNPMCWAVAGLLGIRDFKMADGSSLGSYNWSRWLSGSYARIANAGANTLVYYVDSFNESSEDFGNDTRESSLVSNINGYSDTVKEINYLMNYQNGELTAMADNDIVKGLGSQIEELVNTFTSGAGVIKALAGNATTILAGGKIIFPELWSDSSFDRSYSINIKLRSPDSDPVSIYLNILVPFIHLLALTAPRNFNNMNEGYISPFLVRAYFKGIMNIDLGIVTGLSVTRGGEGNWTLDNMPTSVDINLTIKDLYKSMYLADAGAADAEKFICNDGEMDYLMNLAGINIAQESVQRRLTLEWAVRSGAAANMFADIGIQVRNDLQNAINRWFTY